MDDLKVLEHFGITKEYLCKRFYELFKEDIKEDYDYQGMIESAISEKISKIKKEIKDIIGKDIKEYVHSLVRGEIQPVDQWGEPVGNKTTIKQQIIDVANNYLSEYVTPDGKTSAYSSKQTRLQYVVKQVLESSFSKEFNEVVSNYMREVKANLPKQLSKEIAENILHCLKH